jgi:hypothetical protein
MRSSEDLPAAASGHDHGLAGGQTETQARNTSRPPRLQVSSSALSCITAAKGATLAAENPDILHIFGVDPGQYGVGREKTL